MTVIWQTYGGQVAARLGKQRRSGPTGAWLDGETSSILCSAAAFLRVGAEFQFGFFAHEQPGCGAEARLILAHLAFRARDFKAEMAAKQRLDDRI